MTRMNLAYMLVNEHVLNFDFAHFKLFCLGRVAYAVDSVDA